MASPLHAHDLLERVHHVHKVVLRFHHSVDVLVGRGCIVDHALVLAALEAFGCRAMSRGLGKHCARTRASGREHGGHGRAAMRMMHNSAYFVQFLMN